MIKIKYIILFVLITAGFTACDNDDFENKFDQLPDERIRSTIKEYKEILVGSEFGWKMTYYIDSKIEYVGYNVAVFGEDNTVSLTSKFIDDPVKSEYTIKAEADLELIFNTFNENLTALSYPSGDAPDGFGGDIEFNFVSVSEDQTEIILKGKVYEGTLILKKAERDISSFDEVDENIKRLGQQKTARYMNLAITSGLGASEENPVLIGLDLSSLAAAGDYNYNYKGEYYSGRKMLYFHHDGMGLSSPIQIDDSKIQDFSYNVDKKRYELVNSDLQGYIYSSKLPVFSIPGVFDEFMNHYSLKLKRSNGLVWDKYISMKKANPVIKSVVVVTDYKQRIPKFDEEGNPILDQSNLQDYDFGKHMGEGLLFSFEEHNQFYFYFVPLEFTKISGDRLKMKRVVGEFCTKDDEDPSVGNSIKNNSEFNEFVDYLCNDGGWFIRLIIEANQIDWDFISLDNPDDFFITRLY
ncbi:hypothetical protein DF185_10040 [Marinifilum breve]|uniref:DUF4302 domain-containing protein n=1 Tax=Marinifilum breve TaxID=2184082 RepID=A0A2V3ZXM6_9BACT|nr:DUF4302 domain-containing protein [Marinifilum breve]PXY00991.1 hypothetical protein DF185_10040 [Marinifilum breve]